MKDLRGVIDGYRAVLHDGAGYSDWLARYEALLRCLSPEDGRRLELEFNWATMAGTADPEPITELRDTTNDHTVSV